MTDAIQEQAAMELAWRTEAKAADLKPEDRALIERLFGSQWLRSGQGTVTTGGLSLLLQAARSEGDVSRRGQKEEKEVYRGCGSDHSGSRDEPTVGATAALAKKTMTLTLTDEEMAALEEVMKARDATPRTIFRSALKVFQLEARGLATIDIDLGPLAAPPSPTGEVGGVDLGCDYCRDGDPIPPDEDYWKCPRCDAEWYPNDAAPPSREA